MKYATVGVDIETGKIHFIKIYANLNNALLEIEKQVDKSVCLEKEKNTKGSNAIVDFQDFKVDVKKGKRQREIWQVFAIEKENKTEGVYIGLDLDRYNQIMKNTIERIMNTEEQKSDGYVVLEKLGFLKEDFVRLGYYEIAREIYASKA